jgi:nickel-dependent lactate racemase
MRVSVSFEDQQFEFDVSSDALLGTWVGPSVMAPDEVAGAVQKALGGPLDFPPFRQLVVPGDRVAIALDRTLTCAAPILRTLEEILQEAGVDPHHVTIVTTRDSNAEPARDWPPDMIVEVHEPERREALAYLATTNAGRRVYLNRHLTDADVVIPVGRLGFDPIVGYRGPWSILFPGLSNQETQVSYRARMADDSPEWQSPRSRLDEPFEVNWLLGTQFAIGVVPGSAGPVEIVAGLAESVRDQGIKAVDRLWTFQPPERAECVVAGIGASGSAAGIPELVEGLVTASRLVQQGGKIVALSRAVGSIGPSLQRLKDAVDSRLASQALRGHEADEDSVAARRLAQVLAWADVYLLSGLESQLVDDLGMVPLDHPRDASRLVAGARSCIFVSQAELTRAVVRE